MVMLQDGVIPASVLPALSDAAGLPRSVLTTLTNIPSGTHGWARVRRTQVPMAGATLAHLWAQVRADQGRGVEPTTERDIEALLWFIGGIVAEQGLIVGRLEPANSRPQLAEVPESLRDLARELERGRQEIERLGEPCGVLGRLFGIVTSTG